MSSTKNFFWPLALFMAVLGTVTSQSVLDFFTILMFVAIVVDFVKEKELTLKKFKLIGIEWAFVAYFIVIVIGFIFNASADAEVKWQLSKFNWVLNLYIYIYAIGKIKLGYKNLIYYFSLAFLIPNIYAVTTYIYGWDFLTETMAPRIVGFLNSATYHAHANAIIFVVFSALVFHFWRRMQPKMQVLVSVGWALFFLSIFLTFTRGIWISILISSVVMISIISYKKALIFVAITIVLFLGVYYSWEPLRLRINPEKSTASTSERLNLIKVNLQMWQENPLFGIGYGENMRRNREYWNQPQWNMPADYITSHAHNQYLNVLATTGVFGLFFFLFFMGHFVKRNIQMLWIEKNKKSFKYALIFACMWAQIEFLLACVTDVTFEYAKIRALFLFVWALLVVLDRNDIKLEDEALS